MNILHIDREFPFQIEMPPPNDLARQAAMDKFCATVPFQMRTEGARYRWCFPNKALAEWFRDEFGGEFYDLSQNEE